MGENFDCIWITGASSGIGAEAAKQYSKGNSRLILSARSLDKLQALKSSLPCPERITIAALDLSDSSSINTAVEQVLAKEIIPNLVFHAGGISQRSYAMETSIEVDRRIMEVNYFGTIELTKALLPAMIKNGGGSFAVVTSLVGLFGYGVRSAYSASKHALHGFFESLDVELGDQGINSTLICPGGVQTNISLNALQGDGTKTGEMDEMQSEGMPVAEAVSKMIAGVKRKKHLLVIGSGKEKLGVFMYKYFPSIFFKIAAKQNPRGSVKL
ncbi:SDR family NAD(P)-dependent oxidoreductase [Cryomorphaceae bacterium 1068]|nr:SDR family NAD(P)-dependent oxidoreductase [Cryomorphaceae bacterium 1068]